MTLKIMIQHHGIVQINVEIKYGIHQKGRKLRRKIVPHGSQKVRFSLLYTSINLKIQLLSL